MGGPLSPDLSWRMDAYWRAANYLSVGQIYRHDNPLLRGPLQPEHIKPRLLGHWGTTPGQNFIYVHLNRVIKQYNLNMVYISGPGHGGPALVADTYLEGTYCELYPNVAQDGFAQKVRITICHYDVHADFNVSLSPSAPLRINSAKGLKA